MILIGSYMRALVKGFAPTKICSNRYGYSYSFGIGFPTDKGLDEYLLMGNTEIVSHEPRDCINLHRLDYDNVRGFPPSFAGWRALGEAISILQSGQVKH